jgi:steroid 5-alpha reductase family enzyme
MHLLGQRTLGITILLVLGLLVIVKRLATGSLIEYKSRDNLWVWMTNLFNLFFLLAVNPIAALLLVAVKFENLDPSRLEIGSPRLVTSLEIAGLVLYLSGILLMVWALLSLAGNYQLGGSAPRPMDEMILSGPYRFLRHPMYSAALSISLGLALLVQSLAFFCVFCVYLALILLLIPIEEEKLGHAYSGRYQAYQKKVRKLIPYLY